MATRKVRRPSWDSDGELLDDISTKASFDFDKEMDEDELLGSTDEEDMSKHGVDNAKSHTTPITTTTTIIIPSTITLESKWNRHHENEDTEDEDNGGDNRPHCFISFADSTVALSESLVESVHCAVNYCDDLGNHSDENVDGENAKKEKMENDGGHNFGYNFELLDEGGLQLELEENETKQKNSNNLPVDDIANASEDTSDGVCRDVEQGDNDIGKEDKMEGQEELGHNEEEDEEEGDDDNSRHRNRFVAERNPSDRPRQVLPRVNVSEIPDTLEISKEDEKRIAEFVNQKGTQQRNKCNNNNNFVNRQVQPRLQQPLLNLRGPMQNVLRPGLLRPPATFRQQQLLLHLHQQRLQASAGSRPAGLGLAQTLANAAVSLMMMDSSIQKQQHLALRQRLPESSLLQITGHSLPNMLLQQQQQKQQQQQRLPPHIRFQKTLNPDNRLLIPYALAFSQPSNFINNTTKNHNNLQPQLTLTTGSMLSAPRQQLVPGIQIGHTSRPGQPRGIPPSAHIHHTPSHLLPPPILEQPKVVTCPVVSQRVQAHQPNTGPGIFISPNHIPPSGVNVLISSQQQQQQQQIATSFIHPPIRTITQLEPSLQQQQQPQHISSFVHITNNIQLQQKQSPMAGPNPSQHLQTQNSANLSSVIGQQAGAQLQMSEMIGQPIETVVLRQPGAKNKHQRTNTGPTNNNLALPQETKEKPKTTYELQQDEILAKRAERFSKPPQLTSSTLKTTSVASPPRNACIALKRSGSLTSVLTNETATKQAKVVSSRKVIARNVVGSTKNVADNTNHIVPSQGDGDYRDYELQKALERQKRLREAILVKKEKSRQLQAILRKQGLDVSENMVTETSPAPTPVVVSWSSSSLSSSPSSTLLVPSATTSRSVAGSCPVQKIEKPAKTLKKVFLTKSQYKALLQTMKTKGIPLPKVLIKTKEGTTKLKHDHATVTPMEVDSYANVIGKINKVTVDISGNDKPNRIVKECGVFRQSFGQQISIPQKRPPLLQQQPTKLIQSSLLAGHPRFLGTNFGVSKMTNSVIINGLSITTKYSQLKSLAEKVGPMQNLHMVLKDQKAIIQFFYPQHAQVFATRYNGSTIDYATVSVNLLH